ncbi:MAG: aspartate aminotransferase family protein [Chloroflexi bacterium]|nr:aspartate aminotransferase family protein [Chloroflexota bacterium]
MQNTLSELIRADQEHLIHPLHLAAEHTEPLIFVRGEGALIWDAQGREYIDGLSSLWNVNVGHGRRELAQAAAEQMERLAYTSNYVGSSTEPPIRLAARLVELAYPNLEAVFFASGGAEANESAFKTSRYYWKLRGRPDKVKTIARYHGYHGVTLAAMSATGMPPYWKMFEPRVPGFVHIQPPYRYRWPEPLSDAELAERAAAELERAILAEGPETVAAFIAEPVQGAGGVIVPPDGYFQRVRQICDRYEVLLIADEVITGFCRTGRWFGLEHWGIQPDILSFAKGVTSAYLPLGGIMVSRAIHQAIQDAPPASRFMHAYTYSGHATCCAVALRNLEIMEREGLADRSAVLGQRLLDGLQSLASLPSVGDVRGLGMIAAVELTSDRATRAPFDASVGARLLAEVRRRGLFTRVVVGADRGPIVCLAPPLVATEQQVDRIVEILGEAIPAATA